jgi:hypothetical protein
MSNRKHLAKLKKGIKAWNQWRKEHGDVVPDLSETNLSAANLGGAKLHGANLHDAILTGANLHGANLHGANLSWARLVGADLSGARLDQVNLASAKLHGADLHEAELSETIFGETDLKDVKGLDTCKHRGPSTIDHRTLAISGPLPLAFLRGCGLSDWQIEATKLNLEKLSYREVDDILYRIAPLRYGQAIHFYSCFISHSTKDQEFVERLHADLQNKGVRCWFVPKDLKIGDPFRRRIGEAIRRRIDEAIRLHEKLLVILSEHSVQSAWVRDEVESCFEREKREKSLLLFPVRLDDAVTNTNASWAASIRGQRHIGDFREWKNHDSYRKAFDRLLKDLKATDPRTRAIAAPHGQL